MKESDIAPDPGAGAVARRDLYAVADSRCQAVDEHREGGAVDGLVYMIAALVTQAPDLWI